MLESEAGTIEREIIERIVAANLHLRFDRVALGLVGCLKAASAEIVPQDQTIVLTITAPIRHRRRRPRRWKA